MKSQKKKSHSIIDKSNPEKTQTSLIDIKKIKQQHQKLKNIKLQVDKQLHFLIQKDHSLLKNYLKKKQNLLKEKQKQQLFIQNLQYKQWLAQQRQIRAQSQKKSTQQFRIKLKQNIHLAYSNDLKTKQQIAKDMKSTIEQWIRQKFEKQQKLLQLNRSRFNDTQTRRTLSRESNQTFFQQRHSRIVKRSMKELQSQKTSVIKDMRQIDQMEKDLLNIRHNSQSRIRLIEKVQNDIISVKNQTLTISRTLSLKSSIFRPARPSEVSENHKSLKKMTQKSYQKRKLSLPLIQDKKIHNQI